MQLVELKDDLVVLVDGILNAVLDSEELVDAGQVLLLKVESALGLLHEGLELLNVGHAVLVERRADHLVGLGSGVLDESSTVGLSTDGGHGTSLVFEVDLNHNFSRLVHLVNDGVGSVLLVNDFTGDLDGGGVLVTLGFDGDAEVVVSGDTVLVVVISGLNHEFDGLSNLHVGEDSSSVAQGLGGASVEEETELARGGGEVLVHHHELHNGGFRSVDGKVGGLAVHLSLTHPDSGHELRVLVGLGRGVLSSCEVDLAVVVDEAHSLNHKGLATGHLTHLGLNAGDGVRRAHDLGHVEDVQVI